MRPRGHHSRTSKVDVGALGPSSLQSSGRRSLRTHVSEEKGAQKTWWRTGSSSCNVSGRRIFQGNLHGRRAGSTRGVHVPSKARFLGLEKCIGDGFASASKTPAVSGWTVTRAVDGVVVAAGKSPFSLASRAVSSAVVGAP